MIVESIPEEILEICREFAEKSVRTSRREYAKRNQKDLNRIESQILMGKVAEFKVWEILTRGGLEVSEPDVEIYRGKKKSFDVDLKVNGLPLHVKSTPTMSAERFGLSWTFQYSNKTGKRGRDQEVFGSQEDSFVALVEVDEYEDSVILRGLPSLGKVKDYFAEPKKAELRDIKKVIYFKDLEQNLSDDELWDLVVRFG